MIQGRTTSGGIFFTPDSELPYVFDPALTV